MKSLFINFRVNNPHGNSHLVWNGFWSPNILLFEGDMGIPMGLPCLQDDLWLCLEGSKHAFCHTLGQPFSTLGSRPQLVSRDDFWGSPNHFGKIYIHVFIIKINVASDQTLEGWRPVGLKQTFYYSKPVTVSRNYIKTTTNLSTYLMSALLIHTCRHRSLSPAPHLLTI